MNWTAVIASGLVATALSACKPAEPPSDPIETRREALDKAKAVEGQLQQARERQQAAENLQK